MFNKSHKKDEIDSDEKVKLKKLNKTDLLWIIHDQESEILELKAKISLLEGRQNVSETEDDLNDKGTASDD